MFTEQGSSASPITAAKVMDVIARLPDCHADAASANTQAKWEHAHRLLKFSQVRMSRRMDTSSTRQMAEILGKN